MKLSRLLGALIAAAMFLSPIKTYAQVGGGSSASGEASDQDEGVSARDKTAMGGNTGPGGQSEGSQPDAEPSGTESRVYSKQDTPQPQEEANRAPGAKKYRGHPTSARSSS